MKQHKEQQQLKTRMAQWHSRGSFQALDLFCLRSEHRAAPDVPQQEEEEDDGDGDDSW